MLLTESVDHSRLSCERFSCHDILKHMQGDDSEAGAPDVNDLIHFVASLSTPTYRDSNNNNNNKIHVQTNTESVQCLSNK